ncbi:MAG: Zinc transporter ATPase [Rickettsiales bacterium]|nr:Zinc transporter ATPase [Rickettsiales bacterium]
MEAYKSSSAGATPIISLENISLVLEGKTILSHISLSVSAGEIVTIIGPNGGGKTSLLRLILGVLPLSKGTISRAANIAIGYMPQKLVIDPVMPMTVERFLRLYTSSGNKKSIHDVMEETGITRLRSQQMHTVSGGEMQRVLLASALLSHAPGKDSPDLLILDEPSQGMDIRAQAEFYGLLERIRNHKHCGILMVSHDLHTVMKAADRVLCINRHICCHGKPEDVTQHPEYLALFGKEEARKLAVYTHHHDHAHDMCGNVVEEKSHSGNKE